MHPPPDNATAKIGYNCAAPGHPFFRKSQDSWQLLCGWFSGLFSTGACTKQAIAVFRTHAAIESLATAIPWPPRSLIMAVFRKNSILFPRRRTEKLIDRRLHIILSATELTSLHVKQVSAMKKIVPKIFNNKLIHIHYFNRYFLRSEISQ
jgi:hypothetical protein